MRLARLTAISALLVAGIARADAVEVSIRNSVLIGKGVPTINIHIVERIAGFELKLQRSDGKDVVVRGGGRPGQTREIPLNQPEGKFGYSGELVVNGMDGSSASMPLQFDAEVLGPLKITSEEKDLDLARRKLVIRLSRPAAKVHARVLMDTGELAMDDEVSFNGEPAGAPLEISWPQAQGTVMKIDLTAHDTSGTFGTYYVYPPWHVYIPHEEVNFDTNQWEIRPEERPKLDKSYELIRDAVAKYGRFAEIKLFIAGHTDSVGTNDSNRTLSLNRARSIGSYLRRKGLRVPILYEGFGEEALLVKTPDGTDEPKNRRAEYIISIENPKMNQVPFAPSWRRL